MACPDGYFQPNWGQQYCVACDSDAALGKEEFALQSASKRKLLGGWWNFTGGDSGGTKIKETNVEMNHDQYHKFGAKVNGPVRHRADATKRRRIQKAQEAENAPNFDRPGS